MRLTRTKLGFTLIELLVVITIIGILATGATTTYTSQIQKARDTTRTTDIKAIQTSVEQVYQDTAEYPRATTILNTAENDNIRIYMPVVPSDEKNGQTCASSNSATTNYCGYAYKTEPDTNGINFGAYELSIAFENGGNLTNKAANESDNGNDLNRYEMGLQVDSIDTNTSGLRSTEVGACIDASNASNPTDAIIINGTPSGNGNCG